MSPNLPPGAPGPFNPGRTFYISSDLRAFTNREDALAANASAEMVKGIRPCQSQEAIERPAPPALKK